VDFDKEEDYNDANAISNAVNSQMRSVVESIIGVLSRAKSSEDTYNKLENIIQPVVASKLDDVIRSVSGSIAGTMIGKSFSTYTEQDKKDLEKAATIIHQEIMTGLIKLGLLVTKERIYSYDKMSQIKREEHGPGSCPSCDDDYDDIPDNIPTV
jgi:hypothetical protein